MYFRIFIMRRSVRILQVFLFSILCVPVRAQDVESPMFSFGVIADVQYADADPSGKRDYRGSPDRLKKCIGIFNQHDLEFIVHAGDVIDRDYQSFDIPLGIFNSAKAPVHFVIGNHEFSVADSLKKKIRKRLKNMRGYYAFVVGNMQFIILDAMDVSVHASVAGTRDYKKASALLDDLRERKASNAFEWNGGIGQKQLKWLKFRLRQGEVRGFKTVLFSHLPLLPENGLHLWNNQEVLALLNGYPSVIAFISGHHHEGGYVRQTGIHHVTLKGVVEAGSESACGVMDVYAHKLVLRGFGDQKDYLLEY